MDSTPHLEGSYLVLTQSSAFPAVADSSLLVHPLYSFGLTIDQLGLPYFLRCYSIDFAFVVQNLNLTGLVDWSAYLQRRTSSPRPQFCHHEVVIA